MARMIALCQILCCCFPNQASVLRQKFGVETLHPGGFVVVGSEKIGTEWKNDSEFTFTQIPLEQSSRTSWCHDDVPWGVCWRSSTGLDRKWNTEQLQSVQEPLMAQWCEESFIHVCVCVCNRKREKTSGSQILGWCSSPQESWGFPPSCPLTPSLWLWMNRISDRS